MKISVEDIPPEGLNLESREEGSSFLMEEGLSFPSPVKINVRLAREGKKIFLSGKVETELGLVCSRCLKPCQHNLSTPLELIYYPSSSRALEGDAELSEEDFKVDYYEEGIIDLKEDVREALILALPAKPLCQPACRGLCPQCGGDLNERECDCRERMIDPVRDKVSNGVDPRLAKLGKLLKQKN